MELAKKKRDEIKEKNIYDFYIKEKQMWNEKKKNMQLFKEKEEIRECCFQPQTQANEYLKNSAVFKKKFNTAPNVM